MMEEEIILNEEGGPIFAFVDTLRSADVNDLIPDEMCILGLYSDDDAESVRYLKMAADRGHAKAQTYLGNISATSNEVAEAISWYQKAADQGEKEAIYRMALYYASGEVDGEVDLDKTRELMRRAAAFDYAPASDWMALDFLGMNDSGFLLSLPENRPQGDNGNMTIAKYWALLTHGEGSSYDLLMEGQIIRQAEANKITLEAAELKEPNTMNRLGFMYSNAGENEKAIALFQEAVDMGDPVAAYNLAYCYTCMESRNEEGLALIEEMARKNHPAAQEGLAFLYADGIYVKQDLEKAWYWCQKALALESPNAHMLVVELYRDFGLGALVPDKVNRAHNYLAISALAGVEDARQLWAMECQGQDC